MLLGTQRVNEKGHLEVGGCDTVALAKEFGTPLYVMDEQTVRSNCRGYKAAFASRYPKNHISYASKAFLNQSVCKVIEQESFNLDVASAGELYTAIKADFPMDRTLLHGNNKSLDELRMAVEAGVGRVVVDNVQELRQLATIAQEMRRCQGVLIRVTPGIDPHTHRRIRTGQEDTKFGLSIATGAALDAVREALTYAPHLAIHGVHCHIGSQLLDADTHVQAIDIMVEFLRTIIDTTGWTPEELDLGGGLGIRYIESHCPPTFDQFASTVVDALQAALKKHNVPEPILLQEPGRSIVGEAGVTLYEVGVVKHVAIPDAPGTRTYVAIDGGMSDNPRPQLYDAVYEAIVANRAGQNRDAVVTIAGKHCETDILIHDVNLGRAESGDILAVQSTGAYNYAMASNYNKFAKPACVFVCDGHADIVSRRETLEDVVRLDVVPDRLRHI